MMINIYSNLQTLIMKHSFFIGAYWGARKESLEVCTEKLHNMFAFLQKVDSSFQYWYKTEKPKKGQPVEPIILSKNAIINLLAASLNYNDDGILNEDLGYTVHLKSGKDFSKAHVLSVTCGCYHKLIPNSVTLNIGKNERHEHLTDKTALKDIYTAIVSIWNPNNGVIRCNDIHLLSETYS